MLVETTDQAWVYEKLGRIDPGYPYLLDAHQGWPENENSRHNYLVDSLENPQVFVLHYGAEFFVMGEPAAFPGALVDMYHGRIKQAAGWPDANAQKQWNGAGKRYLELHLPGQHHYNAVLEQGFHIKQIYHDSAGAYFYYTFGKPRYASEVKHRCRVVEGLELFDLMRKGVDYDPQGVYIKRCLEAGPSFVCEVDGEPVCWSCTHLNRCLGMIYTPPQHRRMGYGRSLAAFQIDVMLELDGAANCFVLAWNKASQGMLNSLGISRCIDPVVWRKATWSAPRRIARNWISGVLAG